MPKINLKDELDKYKFEKISNPADKHYLKTCILNSAYYSDKRISEEEAKNILNFFNDVYSLPDEKTKLEDIANLINNFLIDDKSLKFVIGVVCAVDENQFKHNRLIFKALIENQYFRFLPINAEVLPAPEIVTDLSSTHPSTKIDQPKTSLPQTTPTASHINNNNTTTLKKVNAVAPTLVTVPRKETQLAVPGPDHSRMTTKRPTPPSVIPPSTDINNNNNNRTPERVNAVAPTLVTVPRKETQLAVPGPDHSRMTTERPTPPSVIPPSTDINNNSVIPAKKQWSKNMAVTLSLYFFSRQNSYRPFTTITIYDEKEGDKPIPKNIEGVSSGIDGKTIITNELTFNAYAKKTIAELCGFDHVKLAIDLFEKIIDNRITKTNHGDFKKIEFKTTIEKETINKLLIFIARGNRRNSQAILEYDNKTQTLKYNQFFLDELKNKLFFNTIPSINFADIKPLDSNETLATTLATTRIESSNQTNIIGNVISTSPTQILTTSPRNNSSTTNALQTQSNPFIFFNKNDRDDPAKKQKISSRTNSGSEPNNTKDEITTTQQDIISTPYEFDDFSSSNSEDSSPRNMD